MKLRCWLLVAGLVLTSACHGAASAGGSPSAAGPTETSSSASPDATPSASANERPTIFTVPTDLTGGHGDVDGRWIVWESNATSFGMDHDAIWLNRVGWPHPRLVKAFPKGDLGSGVAMHYPFVTWVEYRETGNTSGPWTIYLYNAKTRRTTKLGDWRATGAGRGQPIPLPDLDPAGRTVVWHQRQRRSGGLEFCIHRLEIGAEGRSLACTTSASSFPHLARVNEDTIAYVVDTGPGGQQGPVSEPRSPDYPSLQKAFGEGGALAGWDRFTREAVADSSGVAWIAESTEYQGGAAVYYWQPDGTVASLPTRTPRFPASQIELVDDAVVWQEPEQVNDVLAVRRSVLDCENAVIHVARPWFQSHPGKRRSSNSYLLMGASRTQILVGVLRSISRKPFLLPFKLAVFPVPELPSTCES